MNEQLGNAFTNMRHSTISIKLMILPDVQCCQRRMAMNVAARGSCGRLRQSDYEKHVW